MDGKTIVYIYKDGFIIDRQIKIGQKNGDYYNIISGVLPGELIVTGNIKGIFV